MPSDAINSEEKFEISQALSFRSDIHATVIINHFHPYRRYKQTCDLKMGESKDIKKIPCCKCVNYCTLRSEILSQKTNNLSNKFKNKFCYIGNSVLDKR